MLRDAHSSSPTVNSQCCIVGVTCGGHAAVSKCMHLDAHCGPQQRSLCHWPRAFVVRLVVTHHSTDWHMYDKEDSHSQKAQSQLPAPLVDSASTTPTATSATQSSMDRPALIAHSSNTCYAGQDCALAYLFCCVIFAGVFAGLCGLCCKPISRAGASDHVTSPRSEQ